MSEVFELKGTIKIEGADAVKTTIKDTAASVDKSTQQMGESSEEMAAEFQKNTAQVEKDFDQLEKNIAKAAQNIDRDLTKAYTQMGIAGAALTAAIVGVGVAAASNADDIVDWSIKLGISTDAVQELSYVANQFDLDISSMGAAIRGQIDFLSQIAAGSEPAIDSLNKLGLSYQQLQGLNPEQQFWAIADAIGNLGSVQEQTQAATDIWGSTVGQSLLPMLADGQTGVQALRDRFQELGITLSEDQLTTLTDLDTSWKDMKASAEGFANTLGATVAPVVKPIFDVMSKAMSDAKMVMDLIPAPLKNIATGAGLAAGGILTVVSGVGLAVTKFPGFLDNLKLGFGALNTFAGGAVSTGKKVIDMGADLLKGAGKFILYIAKLVPLIAAQALAWATNWPVGTVSFLATIGAVGAAAWGITKALGGSESGEATEAAEGATGAAIDTEAVNTSTAEELPQAAGGGKFSGPDTGYPVILHGTEKVTKEENNETTTSSKMELHVHMEGSEFNIPDESYLDKLTDKLSAKIAGRVNLQARYV